MFSSPKGSYWVEFEPGRPALSADPPISMTHKGDFQADCSVRIYLNIHLHCTQCYVKCVLSWRITI